MCLFYRYFKEEVKSLFMDFERRGWSPNMFMKGLKKYSCKHNRYAVPDEKVLRDFKGWYYKQLQTTRRNVVRTRYVHDG